LGLTYLDYTYIIGLLAGKVNRGLGFLLGLPPQG
jgi:hypothetical protein